MEQLCITSFLKNGHAFHLYVYGEITGAPEGVTLKDASKILPPGRVFKYKDRDSYAGFSNIFRYKMLLENGGYWVDTDVVCLKPFRHDAKHVFAAERALIIEKDVDEGFDRERDVTIANCVIKAPVGSAIINYCFNEADRKDTSKLEWGDTGPKLVTEAVKLFDKVSRVANPKTFCPVNWWDWKNIITGTHDANLLANSHAVHLWNEMWRRDGIDKTGIFDKHCIYEQLKKHYLG